MRTIGQRARVENTVTMEAGTLEALLAESAKIGGEAETVTAE